MKKKIILLLVISLLLSLVSCGDEPEKEPTVFERLNSMMSQSYTYATLTVREESQLGRISGTYEMTASKEDVTVVYEFELFATFDPESEPSDTQKTTHSGYMKVRDGKIVEQNGDRCNVSIGEIYGGNLKFYEEYFENVSEGELSLSASVVNPYGFMGVNGATNMSVQVSFGDRINSIFIDYVADSGSKISIEYTLR